MASAEVFPLSSPLDEPPCSCSSSGSGDFLWPATAPLRLFYTQNPQQDKQVELPQLSSLAASSLPFPYCCLLNHVTNMTGTLEEFFGAAVSLKIFKQIHREERNEIIRWVALELPDGRRVEFGSIIIYLNALPPSSRFAVISGARPFGALLRELQIPQVCRPVGFFTISSDSVLRDVFPSLSPRSVLFGRCNEIFTPDNEKIASVVEILPEITEKPQTTKTHGKHAFS